MAELGERVVELKDRDSPPRSKVKELLSDLRAYRKKHNDKEIVVEKLDEMIKDTKEML